MKWYEGDIAEAVAVSKERNAIFVVYIEGKDELTQKLGEFIDEPKVKAKLESEDFVAIKIEGGSQAHMQFAKIYQVVPVPSIFFIGNAGTPLYIGTGIVASSDELEQKIQSVLTQSGRNSASNNSLSNSSADFIATEQAAVEGSNADENPDEGRAAAVTIPTVVEEPVTTDEPLIAADTSACEKASGADENPYEERAAAVTIPIVVEEPVTTDEPLIAADTFACEKASGAEKPLATDEVSVGKEESAQAPATSEMATKTETVEDKIICEGNICLKTSQAAAVAPPEEIVKSQDTIVSNNDNNIDVTNEAKLAETRRVLEQKRRERIELEKKLEKEEEMRRRQEGKKTPKLQDWQNDQQLKELKENMRRERQEEQAIRERIRAQIASDRVERAQKFAQEAPKPAEPVVATTHSPQPSDDADGITRLQFRLSTGDSRTHTFNCNDTLSVVREFVQSNLLPGTGIRAFTLATTYPKREFSAEHNTQTLVELNLHPNAVILVIGKASAISPSRVITRSGGIVNFLSTIFWTLLSPVFAVMGYLKGVVVGRGNRAAEGAKKRANEDQAAILDASKRRNLERLRSGPSTSKQPPGGAPNPSAAEADSHKAKRRYVGGSNIHRLSDRRNDSDDENATWNGNSTQQQ